ncbi:MAG: hypothetical protein QM218_05780 [Candidatus Cloacimonadota bacterium]|nr:hypothetical protein [Candidatus Cloacimonadota bacterium]NLH93329.1 hypothetical protein [Candidatus Cloacimonadota bacterium]
MKNDFTLDKLSVIGRAAEAYAAGDLSEVKQRAERLYLGKRYPFAISAEYPYPLNLFSPRLSAILEGVSKYPDAGETWELISARENIIRMTAATEINRTAAEILGPIFEEKYPQSDGIIARKQMIGYMIKIVMECFGYTTSGGRMQIDTTGGKDLPNRRSNYFKSATRYAKMTEGERDALLGQIAETDVRKHFLAITDLIIAGQTEYQKAYNIDGLTNWDSL